MRRKNPELTTFKHGLKCRVLLNISVPHDGRKLSTQPDSISLLEHSQPQEREMISGFNKTLYIRNA